jgi:hypothetical protein
MNTCRREMNAKSMRWRRSWPERPPRPKVRRVSATEQEKLLATIPRAVARSPILTAFGVQVRLLRGRFYIERPFSSSVQVWGRITPIAKSLLLEVERRSGNWSEVSKGSALKLIRLISNDTKGTFHGLGSLEKSLVKADQGLSRLPVKVLGKTKFVYTQSKQPCTAQEALFHFFGLPVEVIAEPARWYYFHRKPHIVEFTKDRTRVLVRFSTMSLSGGEFEGTCLYLLRDDEWGAYRIRPSQGDSIAAAEKWLLEWSW